MGWGGTGGGTSPVVSVRPHGMLGVLELKPNRKLQCHDIMRASSGGRTNHNAEFRKFQGGYLATGSELSSSLFFPPRCLRKETGASHLQLRRRQRRQRLQGNLLNHGTFLETQIEILANVDDANKACAVQRAQCVGMGSSSCIQSVDALLSSAAYRGGAGDWGGSNSPNRNPEGPPKIVPNSTRL